MACSLGYTEGRAGAGLGSDREGPPLFIVQKMSLEGEWGKVRWRKKNLKTREGEEGQCRVGCGWRGQGLGGAMRG